MTSVGSGISFHAFIGHDHELDISGHGLGFFGPQGSGSYIEIGEWQGTTYVVDGEIPYAQIANVTYHSPYSGLIDAETALLLTHIPNYQTSLNIRFAQPVSTRVLNAKCCLFDGLNINTSPRGLSARIAEIAHISNIQEAGGDGDAVWHVASTGQVVDLFDNPGPSGSNVNRYTLNGMVEHDWYLVISVSPEQVGSKRAGLYVYLEYL